ncbi:MAG: FAD-dependent monooxygenase [Rhodobacteraceae bacterium]|nr:FAD-dependent monooxygenase [Paracoccaceae bacterium]
MYLEGKSVAVIGGGVAGLAAARAAALRGARVTVHEQASQISEVGAGLQISPNGMRVIAALGLEEALTTQAIHASGVVLRDGLTDRSVLKMDLGSRRYFFVHRARLIETLLEGAEDAGVEIALSSSVKASDLSADIILGADGLHSATRADLNRQEPAAFTGQVAWRALLPETDADPFAEVFMGPGRHLVSYPLSGGLRNIVAVEERSEWAAEGWAHEDDPDNLRAAFAGFAPRVQGWLSRIKTVNLWGLFRHPVAAAWYGGNQAILGDAAHPTLPFLAQGANMALEDAWVLAACLDTDPMDAGLRRYQQLRRDRCIRIVNAASANARNYHLSNPLIRTAAHSVLRLGSALAPAAPIKRFDWLYEYDATKAE